MKISTVSILFLVFIFCGSIKAENLCNRDLPADLIRTESKIQWGMTMPEVSKAETFKLKKQVKEVQSYKGKVHWLNYGDADKRNANADVIYFFREGKLARAVMLRTIEFKSKRPCLQEIEKIKAHFIKLYGEPVSDGVIWNNVVKSGDRKLTEKAFGEKNFKYNLVWDTKLYKANLILKSGDVPNSILIDSGVNKKHPNTVEIEKNRRK